MNHRSLLLLVALANQATASRFVGTHNGIFSGLWSLFYPGSASDASLRAVTNPKASSLERTYEIYTFMQTIESMDDDDAKQELIREMQLKSKANLNRLQKAIKRTTVTDKKNVEEMHRINISIGGRFDGDEEADEIRELEKEIEEHRGIKRKRNDVTADEEPAEAESAAKKQKCNPSSSLDVNEDEDEGPGPDTINPVTNSHPSPTTTSATIHVSQN